jgi:hypothetical protein
VHDLIGPLLALLGTVLVALLGYRQWKKQQESSRSAAFVGERDKAYKELWQKLEAVHLNVRIEAFELEKFNQLVQAANIHVIESALYLDQGVQHQVNNYMSALGKLGVLLQETNAVEAKGDAAITGVIPEDVLARVQGLREAYRTVEQQRSLLISQFRKVIGSNVGA